MNTLKISELMERLGELQGIYGDVDVYVHGDVSTFIDIHDVQFNPDVNMVALLGPEL